MSDSSRTRQPLALIALHWATALSLLTVFALILVRELAEEKPLRLLLLDSHRSLGLLVLVMTALRLAVRRRKVELVDERVHRIGAAVGHAALYLLLLILPVLGWATSNAMGHAVSVFGLFHLPTLVATSPDLADELVDLHGVLAWTLFGVVTLHAMAACWHHFVLRNDVLRAMLPRRRRLAGISPVSSDILEV